ncbi:MAG TPA: fimbrial assembly protein, partial [Bacillales bacterium]|nr:fimbrial assembly protein [Bacillales bacterium]
MLVDINLLPKKEPKNYRFLILSALCVLLIALAASFYYFQINSLKTKMETVEKQILIVKKISDKQSTNLNKNEAANSLNLLKSGIEWAEANRVITIPVMKKLTSLLPERGFIQSFKYEESEIITLKVQFDTTSEVAYYLDHLNKEKWIKESTLIKLNTDSENKAEG